MCATISAMVGYILGFYRDEGEEMEATIKGLYRDIRLILRVL